MRPDSVSLLIDDLDEDGRGTGTHEGRRLHVAGALPGDRVDATLEHVSPHRPEAWARLKTVIAASPQRVAPVCPATGRCGGCPLGAYDYAAQLAWKSARLRRAIGIDTQPIVASPRPTGYRSFAKLVYARAHDRLCLGAYAPRSHTVLDLRGCQVVEPILEEVRAALLAELEQRAIAPFEEASNKGLLAYVALRSNAQGRVLVTLIGSSIDALQPLGTLMGAHPAIVGVAANERPRGNAIFGAATRVLAGAAELEDDVGGVRVLLSPTAFFQVNREVAQRLYADLVAALAPRGRVVDAYAGVGGIALSLAHAGVNDIVGIEHNAAAVRDASRAGSSVRFLAADAASGLNTIAAEGPIDALVVNPPRRGLDERMHAAIARAQPRRLAYVSCDPDTLARDLTALRKTMSVVQVGAYDMHPQTAHIETLAVLNRAPYSKAQASG